MIFFLIRIAPGLLPLIYLGIIRLLFVFSNQWYLFLFLIVLLDLAYFLLLHRKMKRRRVWSFALYSIIFVVTGFVFIMMLSSWQAIVGFILVWLVMYGVYLEAVFNYIYRTEQTTIFDLKYITAYINIAIFFLVAVILINAHLFLGYRWWWLILGYGAISLALLLDRFLIYGFTFRSNLIHSVVLSLVIVELMAIIFWWPASMYVAALFLGVISYLMSGLVILKQQNKLTKKIIWRYTLFAALVLVAVFVTAQWT